MNYSDRLKKVNRNISRAGLDLLLVDKPSDILYLTGFYTEGALLLISAGGDSVYFIDRMNADLAEKTLKGVPVGIVRGNISTEFSGHLQKIGVGKVGFREETLTVKTHSLLVRSVGRRTKVVPAPDIVGRMRVIKDDEEIMALRIAAKETVKIWRKIRKIITPRMTEREIASAIDICIRSRECVNSFPTIVASGRNSADPHAIPTLRRVAEGDHVLVDFGLMHRGYCSDLTRVWAKGRMNRKIAEFRKCVSAAHDIAVKMAAPGVRVGSIVKAADKVLADSGYGGYICHSLGHGVGLDIHEPPFLRALSHEKLKKGMVITVEPGLYDPRSGGVRQEDMLLITSKGCEVLTK